MGGYVGALKGAAGQAESAWVRDSRLLHAGIQLMVLSWSWVSLLRYFSTLGSEIFLLVDGWKSFSMQGYSLRSIPCRGCYNWLIFFYLRVVISAGGWKFFLHAGIPCSISFLSRDTSHSAFPIGVRSSQSASWLIFSTLRVEILLLVDGWKSFSLLRRDTVYGIPSRVSLPAGWYFSTLRVEIFFWWMEILLLGYHWLGYR
jgi:hypothetical protein